MKKKNILFINTLFDGGGAEKIARELYVHTGDEFSNSYVVGFNTEKVQDNNTTIIYDNLFKRLINRIITFNHSNNYLSLFYSYIRIKRVMRKKRIDLIHLHNAHGHYLGIRDIKRLANATKMIWTIHDFWIMTGHCVSPFDCDELENDCSNCPHLDYYTPVSSEKQVRRLYKIKRECFKNKNIVFVAPSEWVKKQLERDMLKDERIEVINNGVDTEVFAPYLKEKAKRDLNIPNDKYILGVIAAQLNIKQKGMGLFVEAIMALKDIEKYHVVIAGNGEEIANKLKENRVGVTELGYLKSEQELSLFYSSIDLLVNPSLSETFGLVTVESMSCGTPVIAFNLGPMPEIISSKTGWLVEEISSKALADNIDFVFSDLNKLSVKANACREYIEKNFSLDIMIDKYIKLYQTI